MSEIRTDTINNASGDNDSGIDLSTNDQVKIKTANTTALTVDASQNVGIGTSSPSFESGTGGGLEINNSSGNGSHLKLTDSASGSGGTNGFDLYAFNTNGYIENYEAGSLVFRNNGSERMRITSVGTAEFNQSVGNSTTASLYHSDATNPYGIYVRFTGGVIDDNIHYFFAAEDAAGISRIIIYSDGDVQNHDNSYGGTSDIKLKEQITDAPSQWDDIKALTVRKYKMKTDVANGDSDAHWRLGVIAQEVEAAGMSGLVKDNPDLDPNTNEDLGTTTKAVKYSILYMKAVKALQEAMTRIEALETANTALEARITALENS